MKQVITLIALSILLNLYTGYLYFNSYKLVPPYGTYPTTGQTYTIGSFESGNYLHVTPYKGKDVFYVTNPSCYSAPCSGDKIWVDLDALEIYIESEDVTYVEFENREELIFYLGAELFKRNKKRNEDTF